MKNKDILNLYTGLNNLGNLKGAKFGYAVSRNMNILKPFIDKIEQDKQSLLENYAEKDKKGFVQKEGKFVIKNQEEADKEFEKILNEEQEVKLYKILLSEIPQDITTAQLNGIYDIINE